MDVVKVLSAGLENALHILGIVTSEKVQKEAYRSQGPVLRLRGILLSFLSCETIAKVVQAEPTSLHLEGKGFSYRGHVPN